MPTVGTKQIKDRPAGDFYETPAWCTELLVNSMDVPIFSKIIEPCAGHGAISKVLNKALNSPYIIQNELVRNDKLTGNYGFFDYLKLENFDLEVDYVITNPPFSLAREFIEKSLFVYQNAIIIMLLPLDYMGSKGRNPFWTKNPPSEIKVLSKRPSFTGKGTAASNYGWFHWRTDPVHPISFLI